MSKKRLSVITPTPAPGSVAKLPSRNLSPPWQPGQSGNPGGWSGPAREAQRIARENSPKAMMTLVNLLEDDDPRVTAVAAQAVLDRGLGKAKEQADEPQAGAPLDLSGLSDAELAVLRKILDRGPGKSMEALPAPPGVIRIPGRLAPD